MMTNSPTIPLPPGWPKTVRVAVLHVIALAQFSLACAEAQIARLKPRRRLRAEHDRLRQEVELLREEQRIKDARVERLKAQRRPHYLPTERMAILELRAARGWSVEQTAKAFHVTPLTISEWMARLETEGTERFVNIAEPVNKFPDFVRLVVQQLKTACPRLGKRKIAETLARAGLHLGGDNGAADAAGFSPAQAGRGGAPGETDHHCQRAQRSLARRPHRGADAARVVDDLAAAGAAAVLAVLLLGGCRDGPLLPARAGIRAFDKQPTSRDVPQFLGQAMRQAKSKPRTIVVDKGSQFWCRGFKAWCKRHKIRPRFGAVGRRGSIALVERLIRTLKDEFVARLIVPGTRSMFQRELDCFVTWFNGFRPHSSLEGRTPNEVYFGRRPANRQPRLEPRAKLPRGSPCAEPQARVKGKPGVRLALQVRFHAGHKQLPVVRLREAA